MRRHSSTAHVPVFIQMMHKSHDAPVPYPAMHYFATLQNGAILLQMVYCGVVVLYI